ncbi:MAG: hypothetical protein JST54_35530 [Deltaproteobacteria bacterium]|nr:hypothetical protein [Deltaproteobacteria bacterium]
MEPGVGQPLDENPVAQALAALGAPLLSVRPRAGAEPEATLAAALLLAHREAVVLRAVPVVLARLADKLDWGRLEAGARACGELSTLGFTLELAGRLSGRADLIERAKGLHAWAEPGHRYFFEPRNDYDRRLAELQTPEVARAWGFWLNMGEDAFRSLFERHAT